MGVYSMDINYLHELSQNGVYGHLITNNMFSTIFCQFTQFNTMKTRTGVKNVKQWCESKNWAKNTGSFATKHTYLLEWL